MPVPSLERVRGAGDGVGMISGDETSVGRVYGRVQALSSPMAGLDEDERAARSRGLADLVGELAAARAICAGDVRLKLLIVADRLRLQGHVRSAPFGGLTMRLLDSACEDLRAMDGVVESSRITLR